VDDLPDMPECAVIALSPENTLEVFQQLVSRGLRAAVILGSGFGEAGPDGKRIQLEIVELARAANVAVCGPNCMGLVTPHVSAALTGYHLPEDLAPGPVAAVVHSGSVFWALAHNSRGIRFRYLVSSGNEAVLTATDYLAAALGDPEVRLLLAFLETVRDGERFLELVEVAHARSVPIVVLKVGRSDLGRAAALAHTGALAGSDDVFRDVMRQYGVIQVDTIDELYDTAEFLLAGRLPRTTSIAVVTDSGGEKTLVADWGERVGLAFPGLAPETVTRLREVLAPYVPVANPLDAWGAGNFEDVYPAALAALADDPNIETVVLGTDMVRDTEEARLYAEAMLALQQQTTKPIAVVTNQATGLDEGAIGRLRAAGVPVLQGTEYGYRAIARVIQYQAWLAKEHRVARPPVSLAELRQRLETQLASGTKVLTEFFAKQLFAAAGLRVPAERLVTTLDEAVAAAEEIGYPVVLKAHGPDLLHKSDVGAVRLGIGDQLTLTQAWSELNAALECAQPGMVTGFLVQQQVPPGLELIVGCHRDPTFGMVLSVGLGGELVELIGDVVYHRAPVSLEEAVSMLARLKGARLFDGFRRFPARDRRAAAEAITRFGWLALAAADLIETAEANPLIVLETGRGAWVVDGLVVGRGTDGR